MDRDDPRRHSQEAPTGIDLQSAEGPRILGRPRLWDPAQNLKSEADLRAYLIASFEEAPDDAAYIAAALGDVARARGMTELAKRTGLTRMGLYKALSKDGNPSLDTVLKVLHALGLRLTARAA